MKRKVIEVSQPGKKEISFLFNKEGEEKELLIKIFGDKKGEYDLKVRAEHVVGNNKGRVVVRGVVANGAVVKVKGLIRINKQSQGVDDFLEMRLLVLDDWSMAVAEPELEIEANQVRASHAAAVGQVEEEQMFYLMSKGLSREESKRLIINGFLSGIK